MMDLVKRSMGYKSFEAHLKNIEPASGINSTRRPSPDEERRVEDTVRKWNSNHGRWKEEFEGKVTVLSL